MGHKPPHSSPRHRAMNPKKPNPPKEPKVPRRHGMSAPKGLERNPGPHALRHPTYQILKLAPFEAGSKDQLCPASVLCEKAAGMNRWFLLGLMTGGRFTPA